MGSLISGQSPSKALSVFRRSRQPVTYEVRLEVDPAIIHDYDDWLLQHVREMLALPGFQRATVYRGSSLTEDNNVLRVVAYEVHSRRELDSYLRTHAERMRKEGVRRFGQYFSASRRIVASEDYAAPPELALLFGEQEISGGRPICANCHQPMEGRFCANCGQEDRSYLLSVFELAGEFVGELTNFDSRFFRTLRPLLFRPGYLTAQYVIGKRHQFLSPVRMYIFVSLLFFFLFALITDLDVEDLHINLDNGQAVGNDELTAEQRAEVAEALGEAEQELGLPAGSLSLPASAAQADDAGGENDRFENPAPGSESMGERIARGARSLQSSPDAFIQAMVQQIPTMMFIFLPLIAMALKILYIGSRRYYAEHLIFTLHFHSAVFLLLLGWLLLRELQNVWEHFPRVSSWLTAAVFLYIFYYLYKSMRVVYGQGRFVTLLKFFLLQTAYLGALITTVVLMSMYTLYRQA